MPKSSSSKQAATQLVLDAGRALGAAAVLFHSVVAGKQGLSAVEEKTLDLLQRFGPLSAGELSDRSGLAPPSVTGLISRLEKKGFVQRVADPHDGRKVRVQLIAARLQAFVPLFTDFVRNFTALCQRYSVEELTLIARFLSEAADCQQQAAAKLSGLGGGGELK